MTTSKGTIQGYTGIAAVDKKHQIIIDAQVFGSGQEHHTLKPVLDKIKATYNTLKLSKDIYQDGTIVTADTGFAGERNIHYLHEQGINAYIPDNRFRSRDPKFKDQKTKYGKRGQHLKKKQARPLYTNEDFSYDPDTKTCTCPAGEALRLHAERTDRLGHQKHYFKARVTSAGIARTSSNA